MIWSAAGYLSTIYPHEIIFSHSTVHSIDLVVLTHILDALMMISGLHIYRAFMFTVIDRILAIPDTTKPPKYIKLIFNAIEVSLILILSICYLFAYIFPNIIPWMHCFYILYGVVLLIQTITMMVVIRTLTHILDGSNVESVDSARRAINGAMAIFIVALICLLVYIAMNIVNFHQNVNINAVNSIYDDTMHSVLTLVVVSLLLLGNYRKSRFCVLYQDSVCIFWCCGEFWLLMSSIVCCCCKCEIERRRGRRRKRAVKNSEPIDHQAMLMVND